MPLQPQLQGLSVERAKETVRLEEATVRFVASCQQGEVACPLDSLQHTLVYTVDAMALGTPLFYISCRDIIVHAKAERMSSAAAGAGRSV